MRLLPCVLCVLSLGAVASAAYTGGRFQRQATTPGGSTAPGGGGAVTAGCVACAGAEQCKKAPPSKCDKVQEPAAEPEKGVLAKITKALPDMATADKLVSCFALKFDAGGKEGELRDCGIDKVCDQIKAKAKELEITVKECSDCAKAKAFCNNGTGGGDHTEPGEVTTPDTQPSAADPVLVRLDVSMWISMIAAFFFMKLV